MSKKIVCINLSPSERANYKNWFSKSELKKKKLMPKINVKPVALVHRKLYGGYYLYDINKTQPFRLTQKEKKEKNRQAKLNRQKRTCKVCHKFMDKDDRYFDCNKSKYLDYICKNCYKHVYNINRDTFIKDCLNHKIICLDVETTGLMDNDEIIQLSIIDQDNNVLLDTYCKPENKTEWSAASEINGIYPNMVENCKPYSFYKEYVQKLINESEFIVGYNIHFDLQHLGCDIKNKKIIDVMQIFSVVYGEYSDYFKSYKWHSLSDCAYYYDYDFNAHNSLEDAKATLYCYPRAKYDYDFDIYKYINLD